MCSCFPLFIFKALQTQHKFMPVFSTFILASACSKRAPLIAGVLLYQLHQLKCKMKGMMIDLKFHTVTFKILSIKNRKSKVRQVNSHYLSLLVPFNV